MLASALKTGLTSGLKRLTYHISRHIPRATDIDLPPLYIWLLFEIVDNPEWRTSIRVSFGWPVCASCGALWNAWAFLFCVTLLCPKALPLRCFASIPNKNFFCRFLFASKNDRKIFTEFREMNYFSLLFSWFCELVLKIATLLRPFFSQILTWNWPLTPDMMALSNGRNRQIIFDQINIWHRMHTVADVSHASFLQRTLFEQLCPCINLRGNTLDLVHPFSFCTNEYFLSQGGISRFPVVFIYWGDNEKQRKNEVFFYQVREADWKMNKENAECRNLSSDSLPDWL